MEKRYSPDPVRYQTMTTEDLRKEFLLEEMFVPDQVNLVYSDLDRTIVGGAMPVREILSLPAGKELAADTFNARRELGVINVGGAGTIRVDGESHAIGNRDALYIGRGAKEVLFESHRPDEPPFFYMASYPAHESYPTCRITIDEAEKVELGSLEESNERVINKYIHPGNFPTAQLVMGLTELAPGSVWNTMPCHTHERRMETYFYFELGDEDFVVHLMGRPDATRNVIIRNRQAVLSPSWSIHSGAGTKNYSFIWAMGGENQAFDDMDFVDKVDLK